MDFVWDGPGFLAALGAAQTHHTQVIPNGAQRSEESSVETQALGTMDFVGDGPGFLAALGMTRSE